MGQIDGTEQSRSRSSSTKQLVILQLRTTYNSLECAASEALRGGYMPLVTNDARLPSVKLCAIQFRIHATPKTHPLENRSGAAVDALCLHHLRGQKLFTTCRNNRSCVSIFLGFIILHSTISDHDAEYVYTSM